MASGSKPKYLPPDTLSDDDIERLNDVRRAVWRGGAQGLLGGSVLGYVGLQLARRFSTAPQLRTRNYGMLAVMAGGALGSFLGATVFGKRSVVHIGDIFTRGAQEQVMTGYQERTAEAGGGLRAQQAATEAAMRESHARRMQALEEARRRRLEGTDAPPPPDANSTGSTSAFH